MPNVPKVPGVPNLGSYLPNAIALVTSVSLVNTLLGFIRPQWGIYQAGFPIVPCDNVVSVDFRQDWAVADFPVEEGAFQNYDKVTTPYSIRIRLSTGTDVSKRAAMLQEIAALCDSIELVDIVTPEEIYTGVNLAHYDYRRNNLLAGLLVVDIWATQIRAEATSTFTKSASSADIKNNGTVQTTDPTPAQTNAAAGAQ